MVEEAKYQINKNIIIYFKKFKLSKMIVFFTIVICINYPIPVGKNNRYGHPNKEVLNNLEDSKIYRTDQDGSIMFKITNRGLKIEICKP